MDDIPFYKLNLLNLTDNDIKFLNCFCKENFGKYENEFERFKTEIIVKDFIEKKIRRQL